MVMSKAEVAAKRPKLGELVPLKQKVSKLSIACGQNKFKGIDLSGDADIKWDLFKFPWPIESGCVREVECSHFVEHIPHYRPEYEGQDGWWMFFAELYRICKPGATLRFVHPYSMSTRADWDPTHTRRIHEMTWYYLDRGWREANRIDHYGADVDFEVVTINGSGIPDDVMARNDEYQAQARERMWNIVADLEVILKARKP
jgi:hypothetical protein